MLEHDGIRCLCYGSRNVSERETCASGNVSEWERVRAGNALTTPLRMPPTTPLRTSEGHYAAENACKKVRTFAQRNTVSSVAPQNATFALTIWP